jgi:hypothetical protein
MNAYLGDWTFSAGKRKIVWGKGDEVHVVDLVNANDYTDFIFPSYVDRRLGETMLCLDYGAPTVPFRVEGVWTPTMTADRVPDSGPWMPAEAKTLQNLLQAYAGYKYATLYGAGGAANSLTAVEWLSTHADASAYLPNTFSLDYGQYALRATGTIGSVDLGADWYYGHFKTPSVNATYAGSYVTGGDLRYDRLQSFGVEAATALGAFNLRAEGAYYLTDDLKGTDPAVRNNRLAWEVGFDVDLPVHNMNFNVQTTGTYILGWANVSGAADVDYADHPYSNLVVVKLSDSFDHEKLLPSVKALWGIEHGEVLVVPALEWKIRDDFSLKGDGALFFGGSGGVFDAFMNNEFVLLTATYSF